MVKTYAISRRGILTAGSAATAAAALNMPFVRTARAADAPTLVTSIRSLSNPYHAVWKAGRGGLRQGRRLEHVTLVSEGNSEKGIADIRAMIAKTGGNMVLNVDPNDTPDARPIVEACAKAGVYVVTQWNKPADLHPWDFNPYYVSHIEFDGVTSGEDIADTLFKAMGGKGGIVALGGMISTTAAIERKKGLDRALAANPEHQAARLPGRATGRRRRPSTSPAAWLTRFGDQIKGSGPPTTTWAPARWKRCAPRAWPGKIPIVGIDGIKAAVDAVKAGEFACTITSDPFWQGGMGLSLGLPRQDGQVRPRQGAAAAPRVLWQRTFRSTKDNVEEYIKTQHRLSSDARLGRSLGRVVGPIGYSLSSARGVTGASARGQSSARPGSAGRRRRMRAALRRRLRAGSGPLVRVLVALCVAARARQPRLLRRSAISCASPTPAAMPLDAGAGADLHHPDGQHRPVRRGRARGGGDDRRVLLARQRRQRQ